MRIATGVKRAYLFSNVINSLGICHIKTMGMVVISSKTARKGRRRGEERE
jgi:hypothetical protein